MRNISNQNNQQRIQDSFNRICSYCSNDLTETIQNMQLIVADESTAEEIYTDIYNLFQNASLEGFGAVKGNIEYEGERYHLIVLNISKIDEYNLADYEFDGTFSHELGHIFNVNPTREIPSVLKGNSKAEIDNAKNISRKEVETYADYFSKRTNCSQGLINSIKKYLQTENCLNENLFQERLEQLRTEEILNGRINQIS